MLPTASGHMLMDARPVAALSMESPCPAQLGRSDSARSAHSQTSAFATQGPVPRCSFQAVWVIQSLESWRSGEPTLKPRPAGMVTKVCASRFIRILSVREQVTVLVRTLFRTAPGGQPRPPILTRRDSCKVRHLSAASLRCSRSSRPVLKPCSSSRPCTSSAG